MSRRINQRVVFGDGDKIAKHSRRQPGDEFIRTEGDPCQGGLAGMVGIVIAILGQIGSDPAGYAQFSANESITSTTQKTITYKLDPGVTVPKHSGLRVYVGPVSTDLFGTCSVWNTQGYVGSGDTNWFGTQVPGSYSVAYEQYQRP